MNLQNEKCVIVVDEELPLGIIANTAVILGITLGKTMPEAVGPDVIDQTEKSHLGIIKFPVETVIKTVKCCCRRRTLVKYGDENACQGTGQQSHGRIFAHKKQNKHNDNWEQDRKPQFKSRGDTLLGRLD